jgi:hypothetical protein
LADRRSAGASVTYAGICFGLDGKFHPVQSNSGTDLTFDVGLPTAVVLATTGGCLYPRPAHDGTVGAVAYESDTGAGAYVSLTNGQTFHLTPSVNGNQPVGIVAVSGGGFQCIIITYPSKQYLAINIVPSGAALPNGQPEYVLTTGALFTIPAAISGTTLGISSVNPGPSYGVPVFMQNCMALTVEGVTFTKYMTAANNWICGQDQNSPQTVVAKPDGTVWALGTWSTPYPPQVASASASQAWFAISGNAAPLLDQTALTAYVPPAPMPDVALVVPLQATDWVVDYCFDGARPLGNAEMVVVQGAAELWVTDLAGHQVALYASDNQSIGVTCEQAIAQMRPIAAAASKGLLIVPDDRGFPTPPSILSAAVAGDVLGVEFVALNFVVNADGSLGSDTGALAECVRLDALGYVVSPVMCLERATPQQMAWCVVQASKARAALTHGNGVTRFAIGRSDTILTPVLSYFQPLQSQLVHPAPWPSPTPKDTPMRIAISIAPYTGAPPNWNDSAHVVKGTTQPGNQPGLFSLLVDADCLVPPLGNTPAWDGKTTILSIQADGSVQSRTGAPAQYESFSFGGSTGFAVFSPLDQIGAGQNPPTLPHAANVYAFPATRFGGGAS